MNCKRYYTLALCIGFAAPASAGASFEAIASIDSIDSDRKDECSEDRMTFEDYIKKHKRTYATGSQEYQERKALFEERSKDIRDHNCNSGKQLWMAGHNHLSDRNDAELGKLRGRKGHGMPGHPTAGGGAIAVERMAVLQGTDAAVGRRGKAKKGTAVRNLPETFSWTNLNAMHDIVDQGACGSCWASASVKMLEAHAEIYHTPQKFSLQQLVSCAPNPQECGGNGGCNGSTGELAMDYVFYNGLDHDSKFPYDATDITCPTKMLAKNAYPVPQPVKSSFLATRASLTPLTSPARSFGMMGWNKLPANQLAPLYNALYTEGPVAVSVVAGRSWNMYLNGVMNNCTAEHVIVNHLVVLIGYGATKPENMYGSPDPKKYWQIQNSWGNNWGEDGHIRLIRQDDDEEEKVCGWNKHPEIGTGCKGDPPKVWVCGSCGILYDNVVPHFHGTTPMATMMMQRREQGENTAMDSTANSAETSDEDASAEASAKTMEEVADDLETAMKPAMF